MNEWREEARGYVHFSVWSGDHGPEEVFILVSEDRPSDDFDSAWLREVIREEFAAKREAERGWPAITDCDRLTRMCELLREQAIFAHDEYQGFTTQDIFEIAQEDYEDEGGPASGLIGFCYFHSQDLHRAIETDIGLYLAFDAYSGVDADGVRVGRMILDAAKRSGLEVKWDDTIKTRLLLKGFRWQRRSP